MRDSTPFEWRFNLLAFTDAGVIGSQGLQSRDHAAVATNSLVGRRRKLGYVDAGTELHHPRGEPVVHRVLRLDAERFASPVPVAVEGAERLAEWVAR